MNNKLFSYLLLSAILLMASDFIKAVLIVQQPVYVQPVYATPIIYRDPAAEAVAGAAAIGALCGLGIGALMAVDHYTFDHTCWLYFSGDVLVQWGRPSDWPKEADNVQEIRYR